ncbi:hypothetical protein ZWY2020_005792 [Hordeum vulgare]|nr:hypothetical protein ZWY2020_005792 [Hordeum vulgare]
MDTTGGTLAGQRRVGGRFWALAEDEDPDDDPGLQLPEVSSPSPLDLVCESLQLGYTEEEVAQTIDVVVPPSDRAWSGLGELAEDRVEVLRRIVHRRTSASAIRPWKGPIPKVRLPALTLADFIDSWKEVPARKKKHSVSTVRPPATSPVGLDLGIRERRQSRLKKLVGQDGPSGFMNGPVSPGYSAQLDTEVSPDNKLDSRSDSLVSYRGSPLPDEPRARVLAVSDRKTQLRPASPGFPSILGRARRVPALRPAAANMAAQGSGQPPDSYANAKQATAAPPVSTETKYPALQPDKQGAVHMDRHVHAGTRDNQGPAVGAAKTGQGSGPHRGGGGYQGHKSFGQHWNDNYTGKGGGRGLWNTGGGPGGGYEGIPTNRHAWPRSISCRGHFVHGTGSKTGLWLGQQL